MVFTSFTLKLIAVITMLIDHIGAALLPQYFFLRVIGRLSFPIYCFLLVEGFYHTRDIKKYLSRMGLFAVISEVPFDLAFHDMVWCLEYQNVFFTLFLGLLMVYLLSRYLHVVAQLFIVSGACLLAYVIHCDYSYMGILLILFFYLFRTDRLLQCASVFLLNATSFSSVQWVGGLALLPIQLYNGKPGKYRWKFFFYLFYPVHLFIIYLIKIGV